MHYIVYDIETYPNIFTLVSFDGIKFVTFEISFRRNDITKLMRYLLQLRESGTHMVGFNNVGFDYPVLHYIIENHEHVTVTGIYNKAMSIINAGFQNRFAHVIWDRDQYVPQIDLYKIHHFDNVARATSLKVLEFNMRMENVQDLPYAPGSLLTWDQMDELIKYNKHDVEATGMFFDQSKDQIHFREELTAKYGRNFMNHNDTKIGKDYFIMRMEELIPGFDKKRQTPRECIVVADILLPYIEFTHPEFCRIHEWFKAHTIYDTKGALDLSCTIRGFDYVFGTGGIHGSIPPTVVESDDTHVILDLDVASYYPNLAIANRFYPEHLGEVFCDIYADVYAQRKTYPKGTAENAMLKLALNGVYGDSNSEYSPFFDSQYTMSITINGQLLLCMLAEALISHADVEMIQINTDGLTIRCPRHLTDWVKSTMTWWEEGTRLQLEMAEYSRMFIRDVNNYIAEYADGGKLKRKGAYEYNIGWHQDHSARVVAMAAEAALVRGEDIKEFVESHGDTYDFMLRTKVPRSSRLVWVDYRGTDHLQQNVTRYYISCLGGDLVKVMPPTATMIKKGKTADRRIGIHTGWKVTPCNDMSECNPDDIEHAWYIKEAEKLVEPIMGGCRG